VSIEGFIEQRRRVSNFFFVCIVTTLLLVFVMILRVVVESESKLGPKEATHQHKTNTLKT
jgi:hypothetical protein